MASVEEIGTFLAALEEYYGPDKFRISDELTRIWGETFEAIPIDVLRGAWTRHLWDSPFPPKLSDIRSHSEIELKRRLADRARSPELSSSYESQNERDGLVQVIDRDRGREIVRWEAKDECIRVDCRWVRKIEFLMDRFGAKEINNQIRAIIPENTSLVALLRHKAWVKKYQEWRDGLIKTAQYFDATEA